MAAPARGGMGAFAERMAARPADIGTAAPADLGLAVPGDDIAFDDGMRNAIGVLRANREYFDKFGLDGLREDYIKSFRDSITTPAFAIGNDRVGFVGIPDANRSNAMGEFYRVVAGQFGTDYATVSAAGGLNNVISNRLEPLKGALITNLNRGDVSGMSELYNNLSQTIDKLKVATRASGVYFIPEYFMTPLLNYANLTRVSAYGREYINIDISVDRLENVNGLVSNRHLRGTEPWPAQPVRAMNYYTSAVAYGGTVLDFGISGRGAAPTAQQTDLYAVQCISIQDEIYLTQNEGVLITNRNIDIPCIMSAMDLAILIYPTAAPGAADVDAPKRNILMKLDPNTRVLVRYPDVGLDYLDKVSHGEVAGLFVPPLNNENVIFHINTRTVNLVSPPDPLTCAALLINPMDYSTNVGLGKYTLRSFSTVDEVFSSKLLMIGIAEILRMVVCLTNNEFQNYINGIIGSNAASWTAVAGLKRNPYDNVDGRKTDSIGDIKRNAKGNFSASNMKRKLKDLMELSSNLPMDSAMLSSDIFNRLVERGFLSVAVTFISNQEITKSFTPVDLILMQAESADILKNIAETVAVYKNNSDMAIARLQALVGSKPKSASIVMNKNGFKMKPAGVWKRLDNKMNVTFSIDPPMPPKELFSTDPQIAKLITNVSSILPGIDQRKIVNALWFHGKGFVAELKDYYIAASIRDIVNKAPLWAMLFTMSDLADYSKYDLIDRDENGGVIIKAPPSRDMMNLIVDQYLLKDLPEGVRRERIREFNTHNINLFKASAMGKKVSEHFGEEMAEANISKSLLTYPSDLKKAGKTQQDLPDLRKDAESIAVTETSGVILEFIKNQVVKKLNEQYPGDPTVQELYNLLNPSRSSEERDASYQTIIREIPNKPHLKTLRRYLPMMEKLIAGDPNAGKSREFSQKEARERVASSDRRSGALYSRNLFQPYADDNLFRDEGERRVRVARQDLP